MHYRRLSNHWACAAPGRSVGGATLIELVIAIVIFSAAAAAIATVYVETTAGSANPQIRAQGRSIAQAYMDEILLQRYCEDPEEPNPCQSQEVAGGGAEAGETRDSFDDVFDYDTINNQSPPEDQQGNDINQVDVDDYTVSVTVDGNPQMTPPERATITVRVEHDPTDTFNFELVSERERY